MEITNEYEEEKPNPDKQEELPQRIKTSSLKGRLYFPLTLLLNAVISASLLYFYHSYYLTPYLTDYVTNNTLRVVKINYDAFIEDQKKKIADGKISTEEALANEKVFQKKLDEIPKNRLVLIITKGELIIENAENIEP